MEPYDLRNLVLDLLIRTMEKGELSSRVLRTLYDNPGLSSRDRAFANRLYSGTLEKLIYLDYILNAFSRTPVRKMKPVIRNILRMSLYQMRFMDSVPVPVSIHEGVKLTRKRGLSGLTGFVNGILRMIDRNADDLDLPDYVKSCAPEWLYKLIGSQYGTEQADAFFRRIQETQEDVMIRFCTVSETPEQILKLLQEDGCEVRKLEGTTECYGIRGFDRLTSLMAFQKGYILIQDPSSVMAARAAYEMEPNPRCVLDVCAAPGGKSLYLAEKCPEALVIARDLHAGKTDRIRENADRLGITNIEVQIRDARIPDPDMKEKADLVICDLPCSGLGVIGRKPDIMYRLKPEDLTSLVLLQREILTTAQQYVKPGGALLYSTCTVNRQENADNAEWFRDQYGLQMICEKQCLPGRDDYDGFYYAGFRRNET